MSTLKLVILQHCTVCGFCPVGKGPLLDGIKLLFIDARLQSWHFYIWTNYQCLRTCKLVIHRTVSYQEPPAQGWTHSIPTGLSENSDALHLGRHNMLLGWEIKMLNIVLSKQCRNELILHSILCSTYIWQFKFCKSSPLLTFLNWTVTETEISTPRIMSNISFRCAHPEFNISAVYTGLI